MRPARNRGVISLFICNVLGIHNKRGMSRTGAVHYCGRCGIVTRDDRRQWLTLGDVMAFDSGQKITFGGPGQEYKGTVAAVNYAENRLLLARIEIIPKWRSALTSALRFFRRRGN